ncbi:MAG: DUF305 domain-containing protein [Gemmatimonadetes bacterium]|nr:DUF305 domain-containing protein [Gemmatimonadota bacterium]
MVAALAFAGCATASARPAPVAPAPATTSAILGGDPGSIARARADSIRYPYTAADIHFMTGMIGHHAQAIDMARWAPTHGASESMKVLAARIINAQQDEIVIMQRWLRDRQLPVPEAKAGPMMMQMGGMAHEMLMPGMLTEAQMKELDQARGLEFDRLFLQFMIQHHRGAVSMVKDLFATDGSGQNETVFKFASDVNTDQTTEIARMERMLATILFEKRAP